MQRNQALKRQVTNSSGSYTARISAKQAVFFMLSCGPPDGGELATNPRQRAQRAIKAHIFSLPFPILT